MAYSPDVAPRDYYLFASMGHAFTEQRFSLYEDMKNGSMNGSRRRGKIFTGVEFMNSPKDGEIL